MEYNRIVKISDAIGNREHEKIIDILSHYRIVPKDVERIRSVYKVICNEKSYCLKRIRHGDKKALKGLLLVRYLKSNDFSNVAEYIKTLDGRECVKYKKERYYLTEWIDGKECDFKTIDELIKASQLLGEFHIKSKGFYSKGINMGSNHKNWPKMLLEMKEDLLYFEKVIDSKKIKSVFDAEYKNTIDYYKNMMDVSIQLLNNSNYIDISKKAKEQRCVCHDSFYYQNILLKNDNTMYIIDLDSTIYDIHAYDLAKFIRRILHKKAYSWSFEVGKKLIEAYSEINKLTYEDYEILLAFIIFPHKFWKLGKKKYYKSKKWKEEKYLKKLYKLISYINNQNQFINEYTKYFNLKLEYKKE